MRRLPLLSRLFAEGRAGRTVPVHKVRASRAVYQSADIQRVEVAIDVQTPLGVERIILDMRVEQAGRLVHELSQAYDAIHPPLRPRLGGTWSE